MSYDYWRFIYEIEINRTWERLSKLNKWMRRCLSMRKSWENIDKYCLNQNIWTLIKWHGWQKVSISMRNQISRKQTSCGLQIKFTRFLINDIVSTSADISHTKILYLFIIFNEMFVCLMLIKCVVLLSEDSSDTFLTSQTSLLWVIHIKFK
jgi:hypothetical protein